MKTLKYVNGNIMKINTDNHFDQYFTKRDLSQYLYNKTADIISKYDDIDKYIWLEPSVGEGCFFDILPSDKKIGVDIEPIRDDIIVQDYLKYDLPKTPLIVIGNPPFGHRGVLALEFINHSSNADYVCFILPMFFQSLGKGSIRYRVKGFNLIHEEVLPDNSFYTIDGKEKDVKSCFQIWSKKHKLEKDKFSWYNYKEKKQEPYSDLIKVVTVSLAKNRECGKHWIFNEKADYYISSTYYRDNKVVKNFEEVKYKSGIALIFQTQDERKRKKIKNILENANWDNYSSVATNGCRHIGKSHIFKLLSDEGF
jgi:hypothetical protein